jgi:hypothetical protein
MGNSRRAATPFRGIRNPVDQFGKATRPQQCGLVEGEVPGAGPLNSRPILFAVALEPHLVMIPNEPLTMKCSECTQRFRRSSTLANEFMEHARKNHPKMTISGPGVRIQTS